MKEGDTLHITGNSIFEMMGFQKVTGKVFLVYPDGYGFSFKCDQTGALEICDLNDGDIQVKGKQND